MSYERRWLAVVSLGLSLFLSALDGTIVALALPAIAQHFQLSNSLASAVTLSYAIPLTLLILPAGDLVGRFRTLPTFLISVSPIGAQVSLIGMVRPIVHDRQPRPEVCVSSDLSRLPQPGSRTEESRGPKPPREYLTGG
jgi:hypothetical protein